MGFKWDDLFNGKTHEGKRITLPMRLLSKQGRPFMLLPPQQRAAARCLTLYPAQTKKARIFREFLGFALRASLPTGAKRVELSIDPHAELLSFFRSLVNIAEPTIPAFGALAGNPDRDTQRFIFIVFGSNQAPVAVVKSGLTDAAKLLIQRERAVLASLHGRAMAIPRLRLHLATPKIEALALNYFGGNSPRGRTERELQVVLRSWLNSGEKLPVSHLAVWNRMEAALNDQTISRRISDLRDQPVLPCVQHGDFAPWNIKVQPDGSWIVLDWERGETAGIPAWDWFHFLIQTAVLVDHSSTGIILSRLEALLHSDLFKEYANLSGILGKEQSLLIAYLIYVLHVIKPAEGIEQNRKLLAAILERGSSNL